MDVQMEHFNQGFDSPTRNLARIVSSFFHEYDLTVNSFSSDKEAAELLFKFVSDKTQLQLNDLEVHVSKIEGGYNGFLKTSLISRTLFFEIVK